MAKSNLFTNCLLSLTTAGSISLTTMTLDEFKNRVDGTINDFATGIYDATEFRSSILDLLILVASPHLERKPKNAPEGLTKFMTGERAEGSVIIRPETIAARIWKLTPDMIRLIEEIINDLPTDPDEGPLSDIQLEAIDLHRKLKPGKYHVDPDHTPEQIMQNTQAVIDSGFLQADHGFEVGDAVRVRADSIEAVAEYTNRGEADRTYFVKQIASGTGKLVLALDQDLQQPAYIKVRPEHVARLTF